MAVGPPGVVPARIRWFGRVSGAHVVVALAGLLGGVLTLAALRADARDVRVVVAAHDLRVGSRVVAGDLRAVAVHGDVSALSSLVRAESGTRIVGDVIVAPVRRGDPLRASDVAAVSASGGARSVSFAVDERDAVGGALDAGDRIDVVGVAHDGHDAGFVLVDAPVLAVHVPSSSGPLHTSDGQVEITVSVSGDDALRLAGAVANARVIAVDATGATPLGGAITRYPLPVASTVNGGHGG